LVHTPSLKKALSLPTGVRMGVVHQDHMVTATWDEYGNYVWYRSRDHYNLDHILLVYMRYLDHMAAAVVAVLVYLVFLRTRPSLLV
jgi:topoisomerase IA-like protein